MKNKEYQKNLKKLNSDLERYQIIVDYFLENRDRVKLNQDFLSNMKNILHYSETENILCRKESCLRTDVSDILEAQKWSEILKC